VKGVFGMVNYSIKLLLVLLLVFTAAASAATIIVRAHGTAGSESVILLVGGSTVATWTMTTSYANYTATTNNTGEIRVQFTNDASGRDVQVDYITVNGTTLQAENQATNTGVYQNSKCGGSYSEWLYCNGYISFGNVSGGSSSSSSSSGGSCSGNVYLCFDDGPSNSNSGNLVNALKNAGAKATLFVIGQNIASNGTGWNVYKNSGFSCQNHSQTHQHMTSWSYQQVYNDLSACNSAIQNGGKPKPTKIRLPYLENNSTITSAANALGLSIVQPNVDSQDWNGASTSAIISACNNLQNGGNVLMHDWPANTVQAITTIVQNLKNRGLCTGMLGKIGEQEQQSQQSIPEGYALESNYPNPFNPSTTITFMIPVNGYVSLKVYNSLGQEITELAGREYSAGRHSVTFNASNLASGIYFYAMKAGDFSMVQKMILQK
jgi:peptidoglycan-N-acetylglucosamine deacetylase